MPDVMIDLETVGTRAGDGIISLGAVAFDKTGLKDEFYTAIEFSTQRGLGFTAQKSTLDWWTKQSDEAQKAAFSGTALMATVLQNFADWLPNHAEVRVWGNGAAFDNVILAAAYRKLKMHIPWSFWNDRCYRTVKNLYPDVVAPSRIGMHHHALDDAKTQAQHLVNIMVIKDLKLL